MCVFFIKNKLIHLFVTARALCYRLHNLFTILKNINWNVRQSEIQKNIFIFYDNNYNCVCLFQTHPKIGFVIISFLSRFKSALPKASKVRRAFSIVKQRGGVKTMTLRSAP